MVLEVDVDKYKEWLRAGTLEQKEISLNVFWHARIRDEEIDNMIVGLLNTDCVCLHRDALRMLSELKDVKFKYVFLEALNDPDWAIRGRAILGLKAIDPNFLDIPQVAQLVQKEKHPFCLRCLNNI